MGSGTYSLVLRFLEWLVALNALICESIPNPPSPDEAKPIGPPRFLGDVRAKLMGSAGKVMPAVGIVVGVVGCAGSASAARVHSPGEADKASGDGKGVMSTNGPTPGEDTADPGVRELTLDRDAGSADRTLELLRIGRPEFSNVCCVFSGNEGNGIFEAVSLM